MMSKAPKLSAAVLSAMALGLLALLAISNGPVYRAAARDGPPAAAPGSHALAAATAETAYFQVGFPPEEWTFTILLTDTARIQEARDIVSGVQTDRVSVKGTIIKAPASYNPPWSYHLDPASIEFFDVAVEVCDAHPQYVEQHLQEACGAFLPGCMWCPFSSVVVAELLPFKQFLPVVVSS